MVKESFYRYMMFFLAEDTPAGDLARDMKRSGDEPDLSQIRSWDSLSSYLRFRDACPECIRTARECWRKYMKTRGCA